MRPAVFLDRDGTIIEHVHHLTDPADVRLIPGASKAIRLLRSAGYACVVVTNQSVIGRGMLTVDGLERVHDEMHRQLAKNGAELDGIYYCPVVPAARDRTVVEHPERKPGPGMLLRAAQDLGLDLSRSWMIGDMLSDVYAGRNAGCKGAVLVTTRRCPERQTEGSITDSVAKDLLAAAELILGQNRPGDKLAPPLNEAGPSE